MKYPAANGGVPDIMRRERFKTVPYKFLIRNFKPTIPGVHYHEKSR